MKIAFGILATLVLAAGAVIGYHLGNDFLLFLFGLLAFAPATAVVAVKTGVF